MIIDGHAHASGEFLEQDGILAALDAAGAAMVVLSPGDLHSRRKYALPDFASRFPGTRWMVGINRMIRLSSKVKNLADGLEEGNRIVAGLHQGAPDRILQSYWVDVRQDNALEILDERYGEWGFSMVKVHQCFTPFETDGGFMRDLSRWCHHRGIPLFVHLHTERDVQSFMGLCREFSGTHYVLGHCIDVDTVCRFPAPENLFFDISPPDLVSVRQILKAVEHLGSDRICLGSDTPYGKNNLRRNIEKVRRLPLPEAHIDRILGQNMFALLQLPSRF